MTRQVALSNHAYDRLKRSKLGGESFSQAIERLLDHQQKDPVGAMQRLRRLPALMSPAEHMAMVQADRDATRMEF